MIHIIRFLCEDILDESSDADTYFSDSALLFDRILLPSETLADPASAVNLLVSPRNAQLLSRLFPVTNDAAERVAASTRLFSSLEIIFNDKVFRSVLRDEGERRGARRRADSLIRQSRDVQAALAIEVAPRHEYRPDEVNDEGAVVLFRRDRRAVLPAKGFAGARRELVPKDVFPVTGAEESAPHLAPLPRDLIYWDECTVDAGPGLKVRMAQLVDWIATGINTIRTRRALDALINSEWKVAALAMHRAVESGQMVAHASIAPFLKLAAIRVYTSLNAKRTAYHIAAELENDASFERLPEGDTLRLKNLLARLALTSGQRREARVRYRELFIGRPNHPDSIINYILATIDVDTERACRLARGLLAARHELTARQCIVIGELLLSRRGLDDAHTAFLRGFQAAHKRASEPYLSWANLSLAQGDMVGWEAAFRGFGERSGLRFQRVETVPEGLPFSLLVNKQDKIDTAGDCISVIMTSFNSAATIRASLTSVLEQNWRNLEIIVVDDCSSDATRDVISEMAQRDPRVRPIFNRSNLGTYASKNRAIEVASGEFVTFHDSDDWMHPTRLELQAEPIAGQKVCSTSNWIRMQKNGFVTTRSGGEYVHLNPASIFVHRSVFQEIGPFDAVRTGADSEFLQRVRMSFGPSSVVQIPDCLGVGLHHEASLTQSGVTAFDEFRYSAVRLDYTEAWVDWHLGEICSGNKPKLDPRGPRPFPAPAPIETATAEPRG